MSSDLFGREDAEALGAMEPTQRVEAGAWDGFVRGTGMAIGRSLARTGRAVDLLGAVGPIAKDYVTGGTELQDRYFAEHDELYGSAVDYWTLKPGEVGIAGQLTGELIGTLGQMLASPGLAVGSLMLGEAEDLTKMGVPSEKALAVGAVQGLGLGLGIYVPILGRTITQRVLLGGAGFNVVQGVTTRGLSQAFLGTDPRAANYAMLDPHYLTLDVLLGLGFGGIAHLSPAMRAQGGEALQALEQWVKNVKPSELDAIAAMRQAQHMNADSMPGKPAEAKDVQFHVERTRQAIEQAARGEPIEVSDLPEPRFEPDTARAEEASARLEELVTEAERIRVEEGIAPAPEPEPAPPSRLVPQDLTLVHPDDQAAAIGRAVENRLLEMKVDAVEAKANAAIWQAFFETSGRKYGVAPADLMATYGIDVRRLADAQNLPGAMDQAARPKDTTAAESLARYWSQRTWANEAEARTMIRERIVEDNIRYPMFTKADPAIADQMRFKRAKGGKVRVVAPQEPRLQPNWSEERPVSGAPEVDWTARDMQDAGTPASIKAEFGRARGNLYQAWIPIDELPASRGEDIKDGRMEDSSGARDDLGFRGRNAPPPLKVRIGPRAKIEILDGNHRLAYWREQGHEYAPAWVLDERPDAQQPSNILYQSKAVQARWYSELARQLEAANMKAAPAKAWKDYLKGLMGKGAVKAEELKWSGIEEWLDLQGGRVTKEKVQEFLKANGVKVEEAVAGGKGTRSLGDAAIAEDVRILTEGGYVPEVNEGDTTMLAFYDRETDDIITAGEIRAMVGNTEGVANVVTPEILAAAERVERYWNTAPAGDRPTKFGTYQLPGGENYTEVRLILPGPDPTQLPKGYKIVEVDQARQRELAKRLEDMTTRWQEWLNENEYEQLSTDDWLTRYARVAGLPQEHLRYARQFERDWNDTQSLLGAGQRYALEGPDRVGTVLRDAQTEEQAMDQAMNLLENQGVLDRGAFRESHWEEKNVLAHVRFNERTDAEGKRVLFIEEIQSDWAQKGKKLGFQGELAKYRIEEQGGAWLVLDPEGRAVNYGATRQEAQRWADAHAAESQKGVPKAPFVGKTEAWVGLTLKRMIRWAAENGFEKVAWTTGEQQVSRYTSALRKAVDSIEWKKTPEGVQLVGYKFDSSLREGLSTEDARAAYRILNRNDNLGFDTQGEALAAVRSHIDWRQRWDVPDQDARSLQAILDQDKARGEGRPRRKVVDTTEKEDVLSDAIGKSMADRIRNDPAQSGTIEGENIKVDDTGMATFYDRIVPNVAKDILKKLGGGKVSKTELETGQKHLDMVIRPRLFHEMPRPMDASTAETFQGAENFATADEPPVYAEVRLAIDRDQAVDVAAIADRNGIQFIGEHNGEPFVLMIEREAFGWRADQPWTPDEAEGALRAMMKDPANPYWDQVKVISGELSVASKSEQQSIDITPELRERALSGMPLFQGGRRGQIQLGKTENVIGLFDLADASTFMHESGHLFLQMTRDLASQPGAPIAAMDDWATIARWLKTEGGELTREHQEKFATSFERYLADGKAPTDELKGVFAQFRDWLLQIYKSLANIAEDLPDEIRGVMDRMLASQKRDPAPKAEGPPAQRAGLEPPPPPGTGEEAGTARPEAPTVDWRTDVAARQGPQPAISKRGLDDLQIRESLQLMAEAEVGWAQIGGKRADLSISSSSGQPNFTKWIPKSELWPGRPDKAMNETRTREAVRKALAGEKLRVGEQRMVDYMLEIANERLAAVEHIGGPEEWNATAQALADVRLEPDTQNVLDADLVARAAAKDEIAVERAAVKYENDDAAFMAQVRKILGKDLENQAAAGRGQEDKGPQAGERTPGQAEDPVAAAAQDYAEANPEQMLQVGENADGTPIQKSVRQYLEDELLEAGNAREDASLVRAAAKCLFGRA